MHTIMNNENKCVGQYIFMKDDCFTTRIFARYYNMCMTEKNEKPITENDVKNAIKMKKYHLPNDIHIYDLSTDSILFKEIDTDCVMVYLNEKNRIYLATKDELNNFIIEHNYTTKNAVTYILGFPDTYKFKDVRPITSDSIHNAIQFYKEKYKVTENPIFIGIKEHDTLYINLNGNILPVEIDEDLIMKHK